MPEPVYLVLNGPHRGKRYPAIAGETLALPDYASLDSFPATTPIIYTLRVLAVDDPDGTRKANRFWLTADTPTSGIQMLNLLIDLAEEARQDDSIN